jgi:hypothetical protein
MKYYSIIIDADENPFYTPFQLFDESGRDSSSNESEHPMDEKIETIRDYELLDYHPDHEKHLCHITSLRNMKTVGMLAKDAQFLCVNCGRAAKDQKNLCEPAKL